MIKTKHQSAYSNPVSSERREQGDGLRGNLAAGLAVAVLLSGGVGAWAATTSLAGAVLAPGTVVSNSNVRKVQHPTGGVVAEIGVKDGDLVAAGQLLVRLDETVTRANLQVVTKQLDELGIRQARLRAERDGAEMMAIPQSLVLRLEVPEVREMIQGERAHLENRRTARLGQKSLLQERITQHGEEIAGLFAQSKAKEHELELVKIELHGLEELWNKRLASISKITAARREAARLEGELAQLAAQAAVNRGKVTEISLQLIQIDHEMRTDVTKELREAQAKEAELVERRTAAEDQLKRVEIRAPDAGTVHQLAVHTIGGVVNSSEPIMLIVPAEDALVVEAKIAPQEIDRVHKGQEAFVRFPAFDQRTTPEFKAKVMVISADLVKDSSAAQSAQLYYVARIQLADKARQVGAHALVPGMPAEVHIRTGERSALSYLVKPLSDQVARAFKE